MLLLCILFACLSFGEKIPVFIDQDSLAGGSNVLSIAFLLLHPDVEVVGIGVIAGDSSIDDAMFATLQTVEACNRRDVPVARGAGDPFLNSEEAVYGRIRLYGPKGGDGWLGEWRRGDDRPAVPRGQVRRIPGLPDPTTQPSPLHASQLLIEMARKYSGKLVLYTAGPLTNIALAVHLAPDIVDRIAAVYTMAGAIHVRSKFNFWWDAESAMVFLKQNWARKTLVTIDVSEKTRYTKEILERSLSTDKNDGVRKWLDAQFAQPWAEIGLAMWDELTGAIMVDDSIATKSEQLHIGVDHTWGPSYGSTLVFNTTRADNGGGASHPWWANKLRESWRVITDVDVPRFEELYARTMKKQMAKE